jgi:uncharacterized membrane protein required for colicin V production
VVVFSVIQVIGMTAVRLIHIVHLGWIDRLAGSLVGASMVAISAGIGVMLLAAVLPADAELLTGSQLAPMLIAYDNALVDYIPQQAKEAFEENRDTLMRNWIARAQKAIAKSSASPQATPSTGGATDTR